MQVIVNGKEKKLKAGSTLKDAIANEVYVKDSLISVHLSTEKLTKETNDFELVTSVGPMTLHLDDSSDARLWKSLIPKIDGITSRWATQDIVAFGSFESDIPVDRTERRYMIYDCFFSLGGNDNQTTYIMIARKDHKRSYGAGPGRIGRITVGRHLLKVLKEGEPILSIRPVVSDVSTENVIVTKDLSYLLEDGYRVETNMLIELDDRSPESSEQILIVSSKGHLNVSDSTGSYIGCRDDMDVNIADEQHEIRSRGSVTVRNSGVGTGHVLIYKETRQIIPTINHAGELRRGLAIVAQAKAGDIITTITEPSRVLSVGMTQADGEKFLSGFKVKQKRTGDLSDDAIIVDQTPEMTMSAIKAGEVETFAVPKDKILRISLSDKDPLSLHYFKKITGLIHKPIGSLKVQFAFEGMPMVTFYGDDERSKILYPQNLFKKCKKGDIGITNQSRPHHGLIGIRLEDSKEYGPTGEEPYGTNMVGKLLDDISKVSALEDEQTIYITEEKI